MAATFKSGDHVRWNSEAGEVSGIDDYLCALSDPEVMDDIKDEIRSVLLPRLEKHVDALRVLRAR